MKCKICGKYEIEWADTYCQDCWEDYCENEYERAVEVLPIWCFEK
jgi:hypothetical protein